MFYFTSQKIYSFLNELKENEREREDIFKIEIYTIFTKNRNS